LKSKAFIVNNSFVACTGSGDFEMVLGQWKVVLHCSRLTFI